MSDGMVLAPDAGEADFFESLLQLERAANHQLAVPAPLLELADTITRRIALEGIEAPIGKATHLQKAELLAVAASPNPIAFEQRGPGIHHIILLGQTGVISFAGLLLGHSQSRRTGAPSHIENQVVLTFFNDGPGGFTKIDNVQNSVSWADYVAARLPMDETEGGPCFVILANRREGEQKNNVATAPDLEHQNQMRRAISNGQIDIEYVVNTGPIPLSTLRHLAPGSVLTLGANGGCQVVARANGTPLLKGALRFAPGKMSIGITAILAKEASVK